MGALTGAGPPTRSELDQEPYIFVTNMSFGLHVDPLTNRAAVVLKLQSFCKAKDTVKKTKQQPTDWEKIITNPTSDRGLISNIYKQLKKLYLRE